MACYNCDSAATTREHVPPRGFFPRGFRNNLWTVPSCVTHNLDNSLDVEYARNVIVSHRNAAGTAQQLAQSASFSSFEHSSALFFQTFQNVEFAVVNGERTAIFPFDLVRFKTVMEAIAYGLFHMENNNQRYCGAWNVFSPTLLGANDLSGIPNNWQAFRGLMQQIPFVLKASPEPTVFRYGKHQFDDGIHFAYALEFYGGFHIYVWNS
jgi:hypothetical protein